METLKFKTTIKCGGCIAAVTPALNSLTEIKHWEVDTTNPNKILTIQSEPSLKAEEVISALAGKGYRAEQE
nr:cation transporter [uncultured Mucilaginibacter sp.]